MSGRYALNPYATLHATLAKNHPLPGPRATPTLRKMGIPTAANYVARPPRSASNRAGGEGPRRTAFDGHRVLAVRRPAGTGRDSQDRRASCPGRGAGVSGPAMQPCFQLRTPREGWEPWDLAWPPQTFLAGAQQRVTGCGQLRAPGPSFPPAPPTPPSPGPFFHPGRFRGGRGRQSRLKRKRQRRPRGSLADTGVPACPGPPSP